MLNFKKGSIFDRSAKAQEDFMDEPGNQVLAVWGSPGSGKSTVAVKLAKYLDKKGNIYLLDEPTTGLHASDVKNIMRLLDGFVRRGSTVIVIEHNLDVMKQADHIIDIGPDGGTDGGQVVFTGTPREMAETADTITARYLRKSLEH